MADKRITDLTELTSVSQDDLVVVVDNPGGTPITKKITAANLFANANFITSGSVPGAITVGSLLTANANTTSAATVLAAGKFSTNALSTSANTPYQYGISVESTLNGTTANVKTEHAAAKFKLDVSNAAALIVNTYGILVRVANTGARTAQPQAFIGLGEDLATAATSTKYLLDIGQNGLANVSANVSVATGNITTFLTRTGAAATHKLRITVNGVDYFLLCANNSAASI